jgi:hypothetical protein
MHTALNDRVPDAKKFGDAGLHDDVFLVGARGSVRSESSISK